MPINYKVLEIKEQETGIRYLSLECLDIRGDDKKRQGDAQRHSCANCPVNIAGSCEECCKAIEKLAKRLGVKKDIREMETSGWRRLDKQERMMLFEVILNNGIIKDGQCRCKDKAKFKSWVFGILKNKTRELFDPAKYDHENMAHPPYIREDEDGEKESYEEALSRGDIRTESHDNVYKESSEGEIKKVLMRCFNEIRKKHSQCADILQLFAQFAVTGMRDETTYESEEGNLIKSRVYQKLSKTDLHYLTPSQIKEKFEYCRSKYLPMLRRCISKQGYGNI